MEGQKIFARVKMRLRKKDKATNETPRFDIGFACSARRLSALVLVGRAYGAWFGTTRIGCG